MEEQPDHRGDALELRPPVTREPLRVPKLHVKGGELGQSPITLEEPVEVRAAAGVENSILVAPEIAIFGGYLAPDEHVLRRERGDDCRRRKPNGGKMPSAVSERVVPSDEEHARVREHEVLREHPARERDSEQPAELAHALGRHVAQREPNEREVKREAHRVRLELLGERGRARVQRDDGDEQETRPRRSEESPRERGSEQDDRHRGDPGKRSQCGFRRPEHQGKRLVDGHEARRPNQELVERKLHEQHRPLAFVYPERRRVIEKPPSSQPKPQTHHGDRRDGDDALLRGGTEASRKRCHPRAHPVERGTHALTERRSRRDRMRP